MAGNRWYDKDRGKIIYCVLDENANGVGCDSDIGHRSPVNLIGNTLPDMLQLSNGGKSKVVSIGIKDRSAILPGGHAADVVLWWDAKSGDWVTSNYYSEELPDWVLKFNKSNPSSAYLKEKAQFAVQ